MKYGFYVEGRYFAANGAQAQAYALVLSRESRRPVTVHYRGPVMGLQVVEHVDSGVRPQDFVRVA